jgi:hypothetical protein
MSCGPNLRLKRSVLATIAAFLCLAAPAQAARLHSLRLSETLPDQETPLAVALDQATHHFYVGSIGVNGFGSGHNTRNFDGSGVIDPVHPELTGAPELETFRVAVDNSGSSTQGYVYTASLDRSFAGVPLVLQQFDATGAATAVKITQSSLPPNGTPQAGGLPPVVNEGGFSPQALAVNGSGALYAYDSEADAVDVFSPAGTFVKQLAAGLLARSPSGIALDSAGNIYLAYGVFSGGSTGLYELDPAGVCVQVGCAPIDPAPITGVAVDGTSSTVFTTGIISEEHGFEGKFTEYDAATLELLGVTHPRALHAPEGIAVNEATGEVIVADRLPAREGTVKIFGPVEEVPTPVTEVPEGVTDRSATLKGTLKPEEAPPSTCFFQYAPDEEFDAHAFEGAAEVGCQPEGPFTGNGEEAVHTDVGGLRGGTTYHERLVGESEGNLNPGEDIPFTTLGPTVSGTAAVDIGTDAATLQGTIDPNGSATTYRFQYLTQAQFEAGGWAGATEVPAGGGPTAGGGMAVPVSQTIAGLTLGTAYRLRIVAVSTGGTRAGTTEGEEVTFTTRTGAPSFGSCPNEALRRGPSAALPDCRAYEQASPTDKNGADVQGGINSVQASLTGDRVTFFSNTGLPGGEGAQQFPTFLASRAADASSWSTQGLLPPASFGTRGAVLGWDEDLANTYDFASRAFGAGSLLLRRGPGAVSQIATPGSKNNTLAYAASSRGGEVALLESTEGGLAPGDLEGEQNVYAFDRASGRLVVAGVLDDATVPGEGAMGGPYDWFQSGSTTARGGALGLYYTQAGHAVSADGTRIFFTAGGSGRLYVRVNPFGTPAELTPAECRATTNTRACTIEVSAPEEGVADPGTPAAFLSASADGSLVYFLDKGRLTADSTAGPGYDLYRYDVATGDLTDLTPDTDGARVEGMLAIGGPAGQDLYFVASGALAEGASQAPVGQTNLYGLHGTVIEYVARLGTAEAEAVDWVPASKFSPAAPDVAHAARLSADGRTLLFSSSRRLTPYATEGRDCVEQTGKLTPGPCLELYLAHAGQGISCVSCNPTGEAPAGPSGVQRIPPVGFRLFRTYAFMTRNLSPDGKRVVFDSADRLVAGDQNNVNDVYEWEAKGKGSCVSDAQDGGCLYLISRGAADSGPSWLGDVDEAGGNIFFFTSQQLVAGDRDELVDVYDARVEGGIWAQQAEPPARCKEETTCRGAAPVAPNPSSPGTSSFHGPGNPGSARHCGKGKVRKHGRCVRRVRHRHRHRHGHRHKDRHHSKAGHGHKGKGVDKRRPGDGKRKGGGR